MSYPFVAARDYYRGGNLPVNRVVVHTMQVAETLTTAEGTAAYFARGSSSSAHYCVDADSVVQCVLEADTAWHAPPNRYSIGVELAGFAEQNMTEWGDDYSTKMLNRAAALVSGICERHGLPLIWLSIADLRAGRRGITSHNNVAKAFGQSTHWDPGGNFPVDWFLARVRSVLFAVDVPTPGAVVVAPPAPVTLVGGKKMRQLIPVGPLDAQGNGWMPTDIPFDRWESVTPNAVDPETAGKYGAKVHAAACDHGGKVRVVVQGGEPRTTVGVYVVFSA